MTVQFCQSTEAPIQKENGRWVCPYEVDSVGMLDPRYVFCNGDPESCLILQAIFTNHQLSQNNVVDFGSHLPTTGGMDSADDPDHAFLIHASRVKR